MIVKTSQLLFSIVIVSGFLLTLQLIILQILVNRNRPDADPVWRTLHDIATTSDSLGIDVFLVDAFLLAITGGSSHDDIHRPVKTKTHSKSPSSNDDQYCQILCQGQKITQLATLGEFLHEKKLAQLKNILSSKGYTVIILTDEDNKPFRSSFIPTSQRPIIMGHKHHDDKLNEQQSSLASSSPKSPSVYHIIVLDEKMPPNEGHVIVISIYHERLMNNWMRGRMHLTDTQERLIYRQGVRRTDIKRYESSTLFPKSVIKPNILDGIQINLPEDYKPFINIDDQLEYIECNRSRAQEFYEKFPESDEDRELNRLFRLQVLRILYPAKKILDSLNIPFWISSGTLLGYFRTCDVIHYSFDVDIGIFIKDYKDGLIEAFAMNNLPLMHKFGRLNDSFELSFRNEDTKLDIFFFYEERDVMWNGGTSTRTGFKYKYTFNRFNLCWTDFLDLKVRIPCPTLPYIQANYGQDWFTPKTEWDWKTSPPNVAPNGQWPIDDWPEVIQTFTISGVT